MISACVILAAGKNSRLDTGKPKSLLEINGVSLLERHIRLFRQAGCKDFCVVTGHNPEPLNDFAESLSEKYQVPIATVYNERFDLENGFSLSVVEEWVRLLQSDGFFLTMGDHIFQSGFIDSFTQKIVQSKLNAHLCLAVDIPSNLNEHIDIDDVTRVLVGAERNILQIGKGILKYNRYDTGLFYMKPLIFEILRYCFAAEKYSLSHLVTALIERDQATTLDVVGYLWNDIDNLHDLDETFKLDF